MPEADQTIARTFGVVGSGVMGRGIAQLAVQAGLRVLLLDARPNAAHEARTGILSMLERLAAKGKISPETAGSAASRLEVADTCKGLASCDVIVEAVSEDLALKRAVFGELEQAVSSDCILASNTSSLSIAAIAAGCGIPSRVAGLHFFNPAPLMKTVEVVAGVRTAPATIDGLVQLVRRFGHTPVVVKDSPGFLVNHAGRALVTEGLRILGEGIASAVDIDRIMRDRAGFRMGPFELLDLTGLDVSHPVMESIYRQFYEEPRFRPSPITRLRQDAGLLGRKAGEGFYRYGEAGKVEPLEDDAPEVDAMPPVWVASEDDGRHLALIDMLTGLGAEIETGTAPSRTALCMAAPLGTDATTIAVERGIDPARLVAVETLFASNRRVLMPTPATTPPMRAAAHALLAAGGTPVTVIRDSPGFIAPRIVAMIINVACDIAQQRIASPGDIDTAVRLGLGYPDGPLAMGDRLGPPRILALLKALEDFYGDPRYRASPWLKRRAMLGLPLTAED